MKRHVSFTELAAQKYPDLKERVERRMRMEMDTGCVINTVPMSDLTIEEIEVLVKSGRGHMDYPGGLEQLKKDMKKFEREGRI